MFYICIKMIEWGTFHMSNNFAFLAFCAAFNVFFNKLAQFRAFISTIDEIPYVRDAQMACHRGVMDFIKDFVMHFIIII